MPKKVIGYEGLYTVSSTGTVYSVRKKKPLKPRIQSRYLSVRLFDYDRKTKEWPVHRLVAIHFKKNLKNLPQVNHKDGNRLNNKSSNLEWITPSGNSLHAFKIGLSKYVPSELRRKRASEVSRKFTLDEERFIRKLTVDGFQQKEIAEMVNCNRVTIGRIVNRTHKF